MMRILLSVAILALCGSQLTSAGLLQSKPKVLIGRDLLHSALATQNIGKDPVKLMDAVFAYHEQNIKDKNLSGDLVEVAETIKDLKALKELSENCDLLNGNLLHRAGRLAQNSPANRVDIDANDNLVDYLVAVYTKRTSELCDEETKKFYLERIAEVDQTDRQLASAVANIVAKNLKNYHNFVNKSEKLDPKSFQIFQTDLEFVEGGEKRAGQMLVALLKSLAPEDEDVKELNVRNFKSGSVFSAVHEFINSPCDRFVQSTKFMGRLVHYVNYLRAIKPAPSETRNFLISELVPQITCRKMLDLPDTAERLIKFYLRG